MIIESEVSKYKKKSNKNTPVKSNHKHDYQYDSVIRTLPVSILKDGTRQRHYWITILNKCTICNKEQKDYKTLSQEEYNVYFYEELT